MTRIASALAALALLIVAAPASAQECGNTSLIDSEGPDLAIQSQGLYDATELYSTGWAEWGQKLRESVGEKSERGLLPVEDTLVWFKHATRGNTEGALVYIAKTFAGESEEYYAESAELREDIVAMQAESRELKSLARQLRLLIRVAQAQNASPKHIARLQKKRSTVLAMVDTINNDVRAFKADYDKLVAHATTFEAGAVWAETLLCLQDG